ncbi:M15 family metallopeptidase [Natroniella acetigena]|uniref:M15 family metallopeptidase n=1 Tax=Natroniella acetigena TaxID=52004 RepID=UPI00200A2DBF|nr:M15 family metallopeptidase [Natroniella acetigena]MCK8828491.1 M15 family metallopeptidase [Natroniella acetigena]
MKMILIIFLLIVVLTITLQPSPITALADNSWGSIIRKDNQSINQDNNPTDKVRDDNRQRNNLDDSVAKRKEEDKEEIITTEPTNIMVLVNKEHSLPADYTPQDLVIPNIPFSFTEDLPKKKMRKEAAKALEQLFAQAKEDNITLIGVSAYRSYQRQEEIFSYNVRRRGKELANKYSAQAGHSEHQTGLAIDLSSPSIDYGLSQSFAQTKEGKWLARYAADYGFIIRYPQGKEDITGYQYEPWHIRYVSVEHATTISNRNLTLEEYLEQYSQ